MIIWNTIPNDEKISLWKELRTKLDGLSIDKQLSQIAQFCANMPIGSRTVDYYSPENWPTPWEILYHSSFCKSSISLLMYYTLILVSPDTKSKLYLVDDAGEIYILPLFLDKYILNYHLGTVSDSDDVLKDLKILSIYSIDKIKKIS